MKKAILTSSDISTIGYPLPLSFKREEEEFNLSLAYLLKVGGMGDVDLLDYHAHIVKKYLTMNDITDLENLITAVYTARHPENHTKVTKRIVLAYDVFSLLNVSSVTNLLKMLKANKVTKDVFNCTIQEDTTVAELTMDELTLLSKNNLIKVDSKIAANGEHLIFMDNYFIRLYNKKPSDEVMSSKTYKLVMDKYLSAFVPFIEDNITRLDINNTGDAWLLNSEKGNEITNTYIRSYQILSGIV